MNEFLGNELMDTLCGDLLGKGAFRNAYWCRLALDSVVKIEEGSRDFNNILEWEIWSKVEGTPHEKWFAPCSFISACGTVLIQKKTEPCSKDRLPKLLPAYFRDIKPDNFGIYKGRVVCHDYGISALIQHGLTKKMINAKWP